MHKRKHLLTDGELPSIFRKIKESDLPDDEKVAKAFDWITRRALAYTEKEIELTRAMKDEEALIREQIKYEMTKTVRTMFQDCFKAILGKKAWDE